MFNFFKKNKIEEKKELKYEDIKMKKHSYVVKLINGHKFFYDSSFYYKNYDMEIQDLYRKIGILGSDNCYYNTKYIERISYYENNNEEIIVRFYDGPLSEWLPISRKVRDNEIKKIDNNLYEYNF